MSSTIRVQIEIEQTNSRGELESVSIREEVKLASSVVEGIDSCEQALLEVGYKAMRSAMSKQMESVSKKKWKP